MDVGSQQSLDISVLSFNGSPKKDPSSLNTSPQKKPRIAFCTDLPETEFMNILMTAHFLDIPVLMEIVSRMVAEHIDCVESFEGVPPDVINLILSHLSPEKLVEVEESHKIDIKDIDTSDLWFREVERKGWKPAELFYYKYFSWINELSELSMNNSDISVEKEFPNLSWKSFYLQMSFQHQLINLIR